MKPPDPALFPCLHPSLAFLGGPERDRGVYPFDHPLGGFQLGDKERQGKLVTSQATNEPSFPDYFSQSLSNLDQEPIASWMAKSIIYAFEAVEIQHHQCAIEITGRIRFKHRLQIILHPLPVRQTRQTVRVCKSLDSSFLPECFGQIRS